MRPTEAAELLLAARVSGARLDPFTDTRPDLDAEWGYQTQGLDRARRVREGETIIGAKLGLTSKAKQERMGVDLPIVGFLTDALLVDPADVVDRLRSWAQPRIEPEIAFLTSREIVGGFGLAQAPSYVQSVLLAAEILDSRFASYRFRLPDVIADNTSAAGIVVSDERHSLAQVGNLAELVCRVEIDGHLVHTAAGAAILDNPLQALVLLSEHLRQSHQNLPAGSLVLAGALTDAESLVAGHHYRLEIESLGSLADTV